MSSRPAIVLVILIISIAAFCLAGVFAAMTGPINLNLNLNMGFVANQYGDSAAKITHAKLEELLTTRIRCIFEIAIANGNAVLILGAFGCGAFKNPPEIVARMFNKVMQGYLCYFDTVEYAVYHTEREVENYEAFCKEI